MSFQPQRSLVRLRPLERADVDAIMGWVNDPAIVGNLATFAGNPLTRDDELAYIDKMMASADDRVFSIFDGADDQEENGPSYLGQCGLHQIFRRSGVGRLSIIVSARARMGAGVGSAAIARLLDLAFADPSGPDGGEGLHKVWLMCFAENTRARRTYERIGFVQEGVLREEYRHEERWHDMVRYSVLAREWQRAS